MKSKQKGTSFLVVDIGSTKICALIALVSPQGKVVITGIGKSPSYGLKKGIVVNIQQTAKSIEKAVFDACEMAETKISRAVIGISGNHIKSYNSTGIVAIRGKDVSQYDIDRVIDTAKAVPIDQDHDLLHILPQYFRVDSQEYVLDSLGMYGVRLEAQVHIITGAIASAQNIVASCQQAGLTVTDIVLEQIASADAVLSQAEREMGVGIIDIGGGTSDFAIYKDGRIRHSKVIPLAGNHFTNDVAISLRIPFPEAEKLKKEQKISHQPLASSQIDVSLGYDDAVRSIYLRDVSDILRCRAEELFTLFDNDINEYKLKSFMPSGIVLTGGGSLLNGIGDVAQEVFDVPIRIGVPIGNIIESTLPELKSPIYATAYGLLLYATGSSDTRFANSFKEKSFVSILNKMKSWVHSFL